MKLIRIFLVFVAVSFVLGVGSAFNGKNNAQISQIDDEEKVLSTKNVDIPEVKENNPQEKDEELSKPVEKEITSVIQNSKEEKVVKKEPSNKTNSVSKIQTESIEQNNDQKNVIVEQKQEVKEQPKEEIVKQEIVVDAELERLKAQVEYATYDSCMEVGFEKSLEDTVGILGFSCQYIAYKGEILGYKLILNYTNPRDN